jgi:hypothetical protein
MPLSAPGQEVREDRFTPKSHRSETPTTFPRPSHKSQTHTYLPQTTLANPVKTYLNPLYRSPPTRAPHSSPAQHPPYSKSERNHQPETCPQHQSAHQTARTSAKAISTVYSRTHPAHPATPSDRALTTALFQNHPLYRKVHLPSAPRWPRGRVSFPCSSVEPWTQTYTS